MPRHRLNSLPGGINGWTTSETEVVVGVVVLAAFLALGVLAAFVLLWAG